MMLQPLAKILVYVNMNYKGDNTLSKLKDIEEMNEKEVIEEAKRQRELLAQAFKEIKRLNDKVHILSAISKAGDSYIHYLVDEVGGSIQIEKKAIEKLIKGERKYQWLDKDGYIYISTKGDIDGDIQGDHTNTAKN